MPIIGSIPEVRRDTLKAVHAAWQQYGDITHMHLGSQHLTIVSQIAVTMRPLFGMQMTLLPRK